MPVYEYACGAHGVFEAVQPMDAYDQPTSCPSCGERSPRVMMTAPRLGASDRNRMHAHDVNAKAADSPKRQSEHGPGCGCCSAGGSKAKGKSQTLHHPNGAKSFPKKRPWMITH